MVEVSVPGIRRKLEKIVEDCVGKGKIVLFHCVWKSSERLLRDSVIFQGNWLQMFTPSLVSQLRWEDTLHRSPVSGMVNTK